MPSCPAASHDVPTVHTQGECADPALNAVTYELCGLEEFIPLPGPQLPTLQDEALVPNFILSPSQVGLWDPEGRKGVKFREGREAPSVSFEPFSSRLVESCGF